MGHKFETLDGMRGIAATAIVGLHMGSLGFVEGLKPSAYLAVDLFFALSGVVIAHAYGARLDAGMPWVQFVRIRLIRLYPIYLVGLVLGLLKFLVLLVAGRPEALPANEIAAAFASGLFFLPTIAASPSESGWPLNVVYWSLTFELLLNIVTAVFWKRMSNRMLATLVGLAGSVVIIGVCVFGDVDRGLHLSEAWMGLARATFSFLLGILIYRMRDRLPAWRPSAMVVVALLFAVLVTPVLAGVLRATYDLAALLVVLPVLVWLGSIAAVGNGTLQRAFAFGGATSYAVYALHVPLMQIKLSIEKRLTSDVEIAVLYAVMTVALVVFAWWVDRYYDVPVRRWLSRKYVGPARATREV